MYSVTLLDSRRYDFLKKKKINQLREYRVEMSKNGETRCEKSKKESTQFRNDVMRTIGYTGINGYGFFSFPNSIATVFISLIGARSATQRVGIRQEMKWFEKDLTAEPLEGTAKSYGTRCTRSLPDVYL